MQYGKVVRYLVTTEKELNKSPSYSKPFLVVAYFLRFLFGFNLGVQIDHVTLVAIDML